MSAVGTSAGGSVLASVTASRKSPAGSTRFPPWTTDASAGGHNEHPSTAPDTVIEKVRLIIETLAARGPLGLSALARESELSKTTVHRLGSELVEWGVLARDQGNFVIGPRIGELGQLVPHQTSIGEVGQPFAVELFAQFKVPVALSVLQGLESLCVMMVASPHDGRLLGGHTGVGFRAPAHVSAGGQAILAFSPREVFTAVISRPTPTETPYPICVPSKLAMQLREIRRRGFAMVRQEPKLSTWAIGAPVIDKRGHVVGAVEMALAERNANLPEVQRSLRRQAARLSAALP